MSKPMDITNRVYGRLTAVKHLGKNTSGLHHWLCKCECGNETTAVTAELNRGKVQSCGCLFRELSAKRTAKIAAKHGNCTRTSRSSEYDAWRSMKQRCLNPNYKQWKDYGGRGIQICQEWADSFDAFLADVGKKPEPHLTLDRIDNNGNYEAGNVRWADRTTQSRNRRNYTGEGAAA